MQRRRSPPPSPGLSIPIRWIRSSTYRSEHASSSRSPIRLVFSEPLDPRTVALAPGAIELVDAAGKPVPATLLAQGIHVAIDPRSDLVAGASYQLKLGNQLADLGGQLVTPTAITLSPK